MATKANDPQPDDDRLKGWKEIAAFLHTSDRTVQRWESSLHLPVHRIETSASAIVFASRQELNNWLESIGGRAALPDSDVTVPDQETQADGSFDSVAVLQEEVQAAIEPPAQTDPARGVAELQRKARDSRRGAAASWVALSLVAVAALVGIVSLARSFVRGEPSMTTTTDLQSDRLPSAGSLATPGATPGKPASVPVRLKFESGAAAGIGIPVGGTATFGVAGQGTYVLSAEFFDGGARVHISRLESRDPKGTPWLSELAVVTLRPGERVPVPHVPGLAEMEWIRANSSNRNR